MRRANSNISMEVVLYIWKIFHRTADYNTAHRMPNKANPVLLFGNLNDSIDLNGKPFPTSLQVIFSLTYIGPTYIKSYIVISLQTLF